MRVPSILAETEELLVLDKPSGLIVHSDGRTRESSVADWILKYYPSLAEVGEPWISPQGERVLLPGIVHRLDRTTSGVLLIAKTPKLYAYLKQAFKMRQVEKIYRAYVYGHVGSEQGKIVAEMVRSNEVPKRWYAQACDEASVRAAITEWHLLKKNTDPKTSEPVSYLEIAPKTGRTHQIRVHLASIGHPLVADHLYAAGHASLLEFKRPALHALSISVVLKGTKTTFTAPLPPDFLAVPLKTS